MKDDLDGPPTMAELEEQIKKAKNGKAPGISQVTNDAYKAMTEETKQALLQTVCDIYAGILDPQEWHEARLKMSFQKRQCE